MISLTTIYSSAPSSGHHQSDDVIIMIIIIIIIITIIMITTIIIIIIIIIMITIIIVIIIMRVFVLYKFIINQIEYSGLSLIRTFRGNLNLFELWRVRIRGSRSFLKYFGNRNRYYRPE